MVGMLKSCSIYNNKFEMYLLSQVGMFKAGKRNCCTIYIINPTMNDRSITVSNKVIML